MTAFPLPDPPLRVDGALLRPGRQADLPLVYEACQDPDVQRFTFVPVPYRREDAEWWLAQGPAWREAGEALSLVLADPGDDRYLGSCSLLRPDWPNRVAEIGYFVAPWARGRGLAAACARALAVWGLRELGLARVWCGIDEDNVASRRTAERAGFAFEGVRRSAIEVKGRRWNLATYALIEDDLA